MISDANNFAKAMLEIDGAKDPNSFMHMRMALHRSASEEDIEWAVREMELNDIGDATFEQLHNIKTLIDQRPVMDYLAGIRK